MFYTFEWSNGKGRSTIKFDPVKIEVKLLNQHHIYVQPRTKERRAQLVDCLEANGFTRDKNWPNYEDAINGRFPLSIRFDEKTYHSLGNVTNSVCASSSGVVAPEGLFYELCQDELDCMPGSAKALAANWREEKQEGLSPANYVRLVRIDNRPHP